MLLTSLAYVIVGIIGTIVYLLLLTVQVELLYLDPVLASIVAYVPVIILSYVLSYGWVFKSNNRHNVTIVRYLIVTTLGLCVNTLSIYVAVSVFNWWYLYAQMLAFAFVATSNFILNKVWTFRRVVLNG